MAIIRPIALNINKPLGWTSRDVLNKLQGLYNFSHFGHAGTLDPLATGVLIVLVGNATKNQEYYLAKNKEYKTRIFLSIKSPTYDLEGPYEQGVPINITEKELKLKTQEFLKSIQGKTVQTVPYFSSTKVEGKELYAYARGGVQIANLPTKEVELFDYSIDTIKYINKPLPTDNGELKLPSKIEVKSREVAEQYDYNYDFFCKNYSFVDLTLHTGKGFYVRSLANDLGEYLGFGGLMGSLIRSAVGDFRVEDAKEMTYFEDKPDLI